MTKGESIILRISVMTFNALSWYCFVAAGIRFERDEPWFHVALLVLGVMLHTVAAALRDYRRDHEI